MLTEEFWQKLKSVVIEALQEELNKKTETQQENTINLDEAYNEARAISSRLVIKGQKQKVLNLLNEFGVDKISNVPKDKIQNFVENLKKLEEET